MNNTVPQNVHPSLLGPRLHPAHERPPFLHSGGGQVQPQQFPSIQMTNSNHLPSIPGMQSPHTHDTSLNQYLDPRYVCYLLINFLKGEFVLKCINEEVNLLLLFEINNYAAVWTFSENS